MRSIEVRLTPGTIPIPDPRPHVVAARTAFAVDGLRCPEGHYVSATAAPWCPLCHGELESARFGPAGTVWSSTVVRVPINDRTPPFTLAYVDLDDGPRVLAHVPGTDAPLAVGSRVELIDDGGTGDVRVEVVK